MKEMEGRRRQNGSEKCIIRRRNEIEIRRIIWRKMEGV
jgi:hypothetical protein